MGFSKNRIRSDHLCDYGQIFKHISFHKRLNKVENNVDIYKTRLGRPDLGPCIVSAIVYILASIISVFACIGKIGSIRCDSLVSSDFWRVINCFYLLTYLGSQRHMKCTLFCFQLPSSWKRWTRRLIRVSISSSTPADRGIASTRFQKINRPTTHSRSYTTNSKPNSKVRIQPVLKKVCRTKYVAK